MKQYITEFIGTFFLVLVIGFTTNDPQMWAEGGTPFAPLAIGTILMVMVYMGGPISGAHYNPAVSFAIWIRKKISTADMIVYIISQLAGAVAAALCFFALLDRSMGGPMPAEGFTLNLKPMFAEMIFTFALALVVLNVATSAKSAGNSYFGLAIGFTIMAGVFAVGKISGGAFNPAVGLGPNIIHALLTGASINYAWIYIAGPLAGGVLAAWTYMIINPDEK